MRYNEQSSVRWQRRARRVRLSASVMSAAMLAAVAFGFVSLTPTGAATHHSNKIGGSLSVWAEWTSAEQTDFLKAIAPFEHSTGVTVNYAGKGSNMDTALDAAVAGGKPPDVAFVPDPATLKSLASSNKLTNLGPILGSLKNNYGSAWISLGSVNGKIYGVWYKAASKNTVWYNPAEFAAAGIKSAPTTWQGLLTDAATLKAAGITPFSLCTDIGWPVADLWQNLYLKTAGPTEYNLLAQHKIPWTSASVTTAFKYLGDLVGQPSYLLGGTSGALANKYPDCVDKVFPKVGTNPQAAMVMEGDFVVSEIVANSKNYYPGTKGKGGKTCTVSPAQSPCYDFFAFPAPAGYSKNAADIQVAGDVGMILKATPQAKAFIKYIATAQPGSIWAHLGGFTSPNNKVPFSTYPDAVTRADAQELVSSTSSVFSLDDQQGTWEPKLWSDMLNFVRTPTTSNTAAIERTMQAQANAAFAK
jgi:alpha-glucoside transport system substrate-binding protein